MDWLQFVVQWLHILFAIIWFGTALTVALVFIPALQRIAPAEQQRIGSAFGDQATKVVHVAEGAVLILGILRGTVFGPVRSFDALFGTSYGITWLVALLLVIGLIAFGELRITPTIKKVNAFDPAVAMGADGKPVASLAALIAQARTNALIELVWFAAILTCMILMRFGY